MKGYDLILTCEHAGNKIPPAWKKRFNPPKRILESHRGIDIGAKKLLLSMNKELKAPFHLYENSRLLIELNRSLHHPRLFSEFSKTFTDEEKMTLINAYYLPYRQAVEEALRAKVRRSKKPLLHLSMHSFTPVFEGETRKCSIGLLYDPSRPKEREFSKKFASLLKANLGTEFIIRMNYPYKGKADGFITYLRKQFSPDQYVGIEIEVNQALAEISAQRKILSCAITQSLKQL